MFTLNCKGKLVRFDDPVVMGIINAAPDSFYKGSVVSSTEAALARAEQMVHEGAAILDIGGQSSRPGSDRITAGEEEKRVMPVLAALRKRFPEILISVDTYSSAVARKAVDAGADIVNDISAGNMDPEMIPVVASLKVPYICMHMKADPKTMQQHAVYDDIVTEVLDFFIGRIRTCLDAGINDIILDPGFGFAKTSEHNFQLLAGLAAFKITGKPILCGLSRKRTIYETLQVTAEEALNGTTVLNTLAIDHGADILRVHDVKEAREAISLMKAYKKTASVKKRFI